MSVAQRMNFLHGVFQMAADDTLEFVEQIC